MKRSISVLLVLLLLAGCGQKVIAPAATAEETLSAPTATALPASTPSQEPAATPIPTQNVRPILPTFAPKDNKVPFFAEELLSQDGEPVGSKIRSLTTASDLSKDVFYDRFADCIRIIDAVAEDLRRLSDKGRTLTEDRKERTAASLADLMSRETLDAIEKAYSNCKGEGNALPVETYAASMKALMQEVHQMEVRTVPFFDLSADAPNEYKEALGRYMGEPVSPKDVFTALEALLQTEAYALGAALLEDPEAAHKKERISYGSYEQNMEFLVRVARELCPLPDGADLPIPPESETAAYMELPELAFWQYPGMAYLRACAAHSFEDQQARWANAPDGYLAGLAIHGSYAVVPYLGDFGLDYVQYRWYEDMLYTTMTGMSALLIHYYGYSEKDLAEYLEGWGAKDYTHVLYEEAMSDPFESLVASYGYYRYLDICQAAQDAGCESEDRFFRDYLAAGPAPYEELKEYMVSLYQNHG